MAETASLNNGLVIFGIGFARRHSDHSVFGHRTKSGSVILAVYVDILLTASDSVALAETKKYLKRHFVMKDMEKPKYFIRIEVAYKKTWVTSVCFFCIRGNMDLISLRKLAF